MLLSIPVLTSCSSGSLFGSGGVSSGNPCEKEGAFTENKGIEYQCADDPSTMTGSVWRQSRELIEEEKQNTEYLIHEQNLKEACLERKILEKKEGILPGLMPC